MPSPNKCMVPREPIAEFLELELMKRLHRDTDTTSHYNRQDAERKLMSPVSALVSEIAEYSGRSKPAVTRTIHRIRSGFDSDKKGGRYEYKNVTLTMADEILCALGRPFLFYEDPRLREVYERIGEDAA